RTDDIAAVVELEAERGAGFVTVRGQVVTTNRIRLVAQREQVEIVLPLVVVELDVELGIEVLRLGVAAGDGQAGLAAAGPAHRRRRRIGGECGQRQRKQNGGCE